MVKCWWSEHLEELCRWSCIVRWQRLKTPQASVCVVDQTAALIHLCRDIQKIQTIAVFWALIFIDTSPYLFYYWIDFHRIEKTIFSAMPRYGGIWKMHTVCKITIKLNKPAFQSLKKACSRIFGHTHVQTNSKS